MSKNAYIIFTMNPLLLLLLIPCALALTCLRNERNPLLEDCYELAEVLHERSLMPPEQNVKRWGRNETDSPMSAQLPKHFYIFRPEVTRQSTCILHMDAYERPGSPKYDDFKFERAVTSMRTIDSVCIANGSPGIDWPGSNDVVFVLVQRVTILPPWLQLEGSMLESYNVTVGNGTAELRVFSGPDPESATPDTS